jgi:cell division protein FtsI (penicillin-binding protein 3)
MNPRFRLILIAVVVFAWAGLIASKLVTLQVIRAEELGERANRQYQQRIVLTPKRGTVFDRNGRILAINVDRQSIYAVGDEVDDPAAAARTLAPLLDRRAAELERILSRRKGFVWLKRKADPPLAREIRALGLGGIHFVTESKRVYPSGRLAGHVLGFAGIDNDGLAGLEYQYDSYLRGRPGLMVGIRGAKRGYIFSAGKVLKKPTGGLDLSLTIDSAAQFIVEEELRSAVRESGARSGTVVVIDHFSGEILAMANYPDFDPNDYASADPFARKNRAVVDAYEPGSTFKIITATAALEHNLVKMDDIIDCGNGFIPIGSRIIRDHHSYDQLSFRDVIGKSSNVGAIRVGLRVGEQGMFQKASEFGFGAPTGIDLPAENPGLLRPVDKWTTGSIGSISIGQEVSGNPVHILLMAAAVANGGYWVKPYVVDRVTDADGRVVYEAEAERRRIIDDRTLARLRELTRRVVVDGTGTQAEIEAVPVAGKTGTGEISAPRGGYIPGAYLSSFVGYFPFDKPRVTMLCLLDRPKGMYYGGDVAAPLFGRIGRKLAAHFELARTDQRFAESGMEGADGDEGGNAAGKNAARMHKRILSQPTEALVMPDLRGLDLREAVARLAELGIVPKIEGEGSGPVSSQTPGLGEPLGGVTVIRCGGTSFARNSGR